MTCRDRYGNPLSTHSGRALSAFQDGLDCLLGAGHGMAESFEAAVAEDEGFALAHLALARCRSISGDGSDIATPLARARKLAGHVSPQERGQIHCLGLLLEGDRQSAWEAVREHARLYPRDALVAQTGAGVFGLLGFSGRAGREVEHLAWISSLAPHYGDDWWFLGQYGFAQVEAGLLQPGGRNLEKSLEMNPASANSAHCYAHWMYERGDHAGCMTWLEKWVQDYDTHGPLTCHLRWHLALSSLFGGDLERTRGLWRSAIAPEVATGPPINVLTDGVSLLRRVELTVGESMDSTGWQRMSDYAWRQFRSSGISFVDVHSLLAHARTGEDARFEQTMNELAGSAPDMASGLGQVFRDIQKEQWHAAGDTLAGIIAQHERIGGSRAQRDMLEQMMAAALLQTVGERPAAWWLLSRRPRVNLPRPVQGGKTA